MNIKGNFASGDPTLLFIHGMDSSKETWNPVIRALQERYKAFSIDLRGHGETPLGNEKEYSIELLAADVHAYIKEHNLDNLVLVGHSMGSRVAIVYASEHPERVKGLVVEDMDLLPREPRKLQVEEIQKLKSFKTEYTCEDAARKALIEYGYRANKYDLWKAQGRIKITQDQRYQINLNPYASYLAHNACQASDKAAQLFSNIKIPVMLLVAGEDSSTSVAGISQMKAMVPEMQVINIPGSEHSIHRTQLIQFIKELTRFIQSTR